METKMVNLTINNIPVSVPAGTTILEAAKVAGVKIPTLCYMKNINAIGACRVCVVEVEKARSLVAACVFPVSEGMVVKTNTKRVLESRKTTVELLLSNHNQDCLSCVRNKNCELQTLAHDLGCDDKRFQGSKTESKIDVSTDYLVRDNSKCVLCRRCVAACKNYQSLAIIGANARGFDTHIACAFERDLKDTPCVGCGQCITVCPTGALHEREEIDDVINALADPEKYVVVGTAPSVRVAIGEEFGNPIGTNAEGKMVSALRALGFKNVFDVDFAADLTIMEEGYEFLNRVQNGGTLPMITSCSPAWIKFCEHNYPELLGNLSTCKSPQQMFGAIVKTYYAEKIGVDPKNIFVVSVMPCTAKKFEKGRDNQAAAGVPDVDAVLTTRELARLIRREGIMFNELPEGKFDAPLGISTGAGLIFGATGGVMEAALRTVADVLTGEDLKTIEYKKVRGTKGIKEATYEIAGKKVNVAVASGLANAKIIMDKIKAGKCKYDFIEIMSCPGGCVNGGGQPIHDEFTRENFNIPELRAKAIYKGDVANGMRKSHENPAVKELYDTYLGKPNGEKAHHILHTSYAPRKNY